MYSYEYEKPGHGWVSKLVHRPVVRSVTDTQSIVTALNKLCGKDETNQGLGTSSWWKAGGSGGLVSICQTTMPIPVPLDRVARYLSQVDHS